MPNHFLELHPHLAGLRDFGNMSFYLSTTESEHLDKLDVISIVTEELQKSEYKRIYIYFIN